MKNRQRAKVLGRSGGRRGRGFSREELKKAGLGIKQAVKLGASVDPKRRTMHADNVEVVKTFLENKEIRKRQKGKD